MTFFLSRQQCRLRVFSFLLLLFLAGREVVAAPISVSISASGKLTCTNHVVTLTAITTATGSTTYRWTGPNSYSATGDTVTVLAAGIYRVIATNPAGAGTATVTVAMDTTVPAGLTAINMGPLTCLNLNVTLFAHSTSPGVSYSWTGPNGYTASSFAAMTSTPGTYLVTAIDSGSGCSSTALTNVAIDTATPVVTISSNPANSTITCINTQVVLTGSANGQGMTYAWTGPDNFTAAGAVATATTSGSYLLTVTNPGNGCSSLYNPVFVAEDVSLPGLLAVTVADKLSCNTVSVPVTAFASNLAATCAWTGPEGFSDTGRVIHTSLGGIYTVTFTNPANGCTQNSSITVREDTARPAGVTATNSGELTCDVTTVTLTGNSTTAGVNYLWVGPGFADAEQISTSATDPGTYILFVTNPNNGCATVDSTIVTQDLTACSAIKSKLMNGSAAGFKDSVSGIAGFTCTVYPNPVNTTAVVAFQSSTASQVSVEIYNNSGVLERELFSNAVEANRSYRLMLDPAGLAAGIHYCVIRVDGKVYTTKLLFLPGKP